MYQYLAKMIRAVDGDTIIVNIDLGFRIWIEQSVRLVRINAPDVVNMGADGINDPAREFIERECPIGSTLLLVSMKAEKYGRWLADVFYQPGVAMATDITGSTCSLSDELLRAGLVQLYDGGRK